MGANQTYMGEIIDKSFNDLFNYLEDIDSFDRIKRIITCGGDENVNPLRKDSNIVIYYDAAIDAHPMIIVERCPITSEEDGAKILEEAKALSVPNYHMTTDLVQDKPFVDIVLTREDVLAALGGENA